jgi:heme exporter protein C
VNQGVLIKILLGIWMLAVIYTAFYLPIPQTGLGDLARIILFHVPLAWVGVIAYLISMINSIRYLRREDRLFDLKARCSAELGLLFTLLATITGAIFARSTWGMYWNWDPRQTTVLILLLIYGAYFALRSALPEEKVKARLASVYSIFAFVTVPFLVFIIPRLYHTLHPDPIINVDLQLRMDSLLLLALIDSLIAFSGLFAWIYNLQVRLMILSDANQDQVSWGD